MTFAVAIMLAMSFWSHRGVSTPCTPVAEVVPSSALPVTANGLTALAATYGAPSCRILISPELQQWRLDDPGYYATAITHEVGHIDGIGHTHDGGFMDEDGFAADRTIYPPEIRQYIKQHMPWITPVPGGGYERRRPL